MGKRLTKLNFIVVVVKIAITIEREDMKAEVIISDNEHKCCICGKPTRYIEINYQAPFCSDECISEMDRKGRYED